MNDADLELRLDRWLEADAGALRAPSGLRRRIMDIPAEPASTAHWWHRFASLPALSAGVASAGILGILVASMFFGLFDAPAGADGETCNNRQVQQALDHLRDSAGYRYVSRDQVYTFDPDTEISIDNPQYIWTDALASEGAYLAPDRARDVVTADLPSYNRGYVEHVQIDGQTYELREIDGARTWMRTTNWPTANLAYGYVQHAFPTFSIPGLTSLDFGGTPVPDALPGTNGCTAAALIPLSSDGPADVAVRRIVALRVDVDTRRPTGIYLGPEVDYPVFDGASRSTYELSWITPSGDEFQAPTDFVEDPNLVQGSFAPEPTTGPPAFDPSAWAPIELPNPAPDGGSAAVNAVAAGDGRVVAVGSWMPPNGTYGDENGVIWTSLDGASWDVVDAPDGFERLSFGSVAWDGSTYVAIGSRVDPPLEDGSFTERLESWLSTDGLTWERGGKLELGAITGHLLAGGPGWVMTGGIASPDNQLRPAIFTSRDGARWSTIDLPGTASGQLSAVVTESDGSLLATGCESPGATNSHAAGNLCIMRPWRSKDGLTWTPGPTFDLALYDIEQTADGLVAIGSDPTNADPSTETSTLFTSSDGASWTPLPGTPGGPGESLRRLTPIGDGLVVDGQIGVQSGSPYAWAARQLSGDEWEVISLGVPDGAGQTSVAGVVETPVGLTFIGKAQVSETRSVPLLWLEPQPD